MRRLLLSGVGVLALAYVKPARADIPPFSGEDLIAGCQSITGPQRSSIYMMGVCTGVLKTTWHMTLKGGLVCSPVGVTLKQVARVVVHYLEGHPERLDEGISELATVALVEEWPCAQEGVVDVNPSKKHRT